MAAGSGGGFEMVYTSSVTNNTAGVWSFVSNRVSSMTKEWAEQLAEMMRQNVAPGKGPGPHPHRTDHGWSWEDTGAAQRAIGIRRGYVNVGRTGGYAATTDTAWMAGVFGDVGNGTGRGGAQPSEYLFYLELGYHGPSGRRYQYRWCYPAVEAFREKMRSKGLPIDSQLLNYGFKWGQ